MTPGQWLLDFFWNNTPFLEGAIKWVGVAIAVTGAMLVAPQATKHFFSTRVGKPIAVIARAIRSLWVRPQDESIEPVTATRSVSYGIGTPTVVQSAPLKERATLEEKFQWLRDHVEFLHDTWQRTAKRLDEVDQLTRQELDVLRSRVDVEVKRAQSQIEKIERDSVQIDATGLPPIITGIILTGVPGELASCKIVGWVILAVSIGLTLRAVGTSRRSRQMALAEP